MSAEERGIANLRAIAADAEHWCVRLFGICYCSLNLLFVFS